MKPAPASRESSSRDAKEVSREGADRIGKRPDPTTREARVGEQADTPNSKVLLRPQTVHESRQDDKGAGDVASIYSLAKRNIARSQQLQAELDDKGSASRADITTR